MGVTLWRWGSCLSRAHPSSSVPYGECQTLSSPSLSMWLSMPLAQGSSWMGTGHRAIWLILFLLERLPVPRGLLPGHNSFCAGLQGSLSGPRAGLSPGSGEEFLSPPRSEQRGPPGGKSGCYDHNIPVYQAPTMCPVLSGLPQHTKALLTLRKPPTLSMASTAVPLSLR